MYFLFRPVSRITCCRQHGSFIATLQDFLPQDYLHQAAPREVVSFRRPWRIYYPRTQDLLSEPDSRKEIISFRRQDDSVSMSHVRRVEQVQLFYRGMDAGSQAVSWIMDSPGARDCFFLLLDSEPDRAFVETSAGRARTQPTFSRMPTGSPWILACLQLSLDLFQRVVVTCARATTRSLMKTALAAEQVLPTHGLFNNARNVTASLLPRRINATWEPVITLSS